MPLLNAGLDAIAGRLISDSAVQEFDATNAYLAVGNGTAVFSAAHTDLQGGSKFRKGMEATYPQRTANVITFRSLFATGDANFAWEEWGVANASSGAVLLNRKVESLGTKVNTQAWQLTAEITIEQCP